MTASVTKEDRALKVCHTCRYWSYKYKGLCERLNQGVGRFWTCEDWEEGERQELREGPADRGSQPPPPINPTT